MKDWKMIVVKPAEGDRQKFEFTESKFDGMCRAVCTDVIEAGEMANRLLAGKVETVGTSEVYLQD